MRSALMLLCGLAAAQTTSPVFEAADVHVSPTGATESFAFLPGGRVEGRAMTMLRLITTAYGVTADRISGGPNWIDLDRFDVTAKAAGVVPQAGLRKMMQGLLEERFGLVVQKEEKPVPVFVLSAGKGAPPKPSAETGGQDCKRTTEENVIVLSCRNMTFAALAEGLQGFAPAYFNRPVLDRSGLTGPYDFTLRWLGRGMLPPGAEGNSLSLYSVIEKQFSVKVEQQNAPMPVLTISKVNRTPTENPPDVAAKLGPAPTEFEVAEIHPSAPGTKEDFVLKNGRVRAQGITLRDLIAFAYNVENGGVKGEKWLESERFDIVAKTAPTESDDTLRTMLRALLEERFGLKVHKDVQPLNVYGLTAVKPKLKEADPAERTTCRMNVADGGRTFTCTNVTMAEFVERVRWEAFGYVGDLPIVDLTGLKRRYDFVLTWSPVRRTAGRAGGTSPGDASAGAAGVPTVEAPTGITLFEAVERQLGLKLAAQKHPMPVVVVDHAERKPTAN